MSPLNRKNEPPIGRQNTKNVLASDFLLQMHKQTKNEPLAMFRKNELNIWWYKYKNRLTTQTKEEILICSHWHLLEGVFRFSEVVKKNTEQLNLSNENLNVLENRPQLLLLKEAKGFVWQICRKKMFWLWMSQNHFSTKNPTINIIQDWKYKIWT